MIRDITPEDKSEVIRLAELFFNERLAREGVNFSASHADTHFDVFIKMPGILALCAEEDGKLVGIIVGVASAIIFAKELAMQEMVWYVEPDRRNCGLKLLREFERRATSMGIHYSQMVGLHGDPVLEIYPRLGYKKMHETFMKPLG